jgi:hypothetical protein
MRFSGFVSAIPRSIVCFALVSGGCLALLSSAAPARADENGRWEPYFFMPPRESHTVVYDVHDDRMVLFGGAYWGGAWFTPGPRSDVWVLDGDGAAGWSHVVPAGSPPPPRYDHTAIYDPIRKSMIVYGGFGNSGARADTWELSLDGPAAWTPFGDGGAPARYGHTAVYDLLRHRMIVFGGYDASLAPTNQVWALDLGSGQWTQLGALGTAPSPRARHVAIYDPTRDRMVVHGGVAENLIWFLSFPGTTTWSSVATTGSAAVSNHAAVYDPVRDRMVVGGYGNGIDAYSFASATGWTAESGTVYNGSSLTYDFARDRVVVHGGWFQADVKYYNEGTWAILVGGISTTSNVAGPPAQPPVMTGHTMVHDPVSDRIVVLSSTALAMVPITGQPTWNPLALGIPTAGGHTAILDPVSSRMLVFSGSSNETWALALGGSPAWTQIVASNPPPARTFASAIYDPPRHRMILFGGLVGGVPANEVWALALAEPASWTLLSPSGTPPAGRSGHGAIYDPAGDRMIVFGGSTPAPSNETWALTLGGSPAWAPIAAGTPPSARTSMVVVPDLRRNRMIVFGGRNDHPNDPCLQDAWSLSLDGTPQWNVLAPEGGLPAARSLAAGVYDALRDRVLVYGGELWHFPPCCGQEHRKFNDWWQLGFGGPVVAVNGAPERPGAVELATPWPNPASRSVDFGFRLPGAAAVRLAVYDLAGRCLRTLVDTRLEAGEHRARWDLAAASGSRMPAGVYLAALDVGGRRSTRKVAVLP